MRPGDGTRRLALICAPSPRDGWQRCAALILLAQIALRGWAGYRGYFYLDDFNFTARAAQYGLSPGKFLFRAYNNHLMPGAFVEVWILTEVVAAELRRGR